MTSQLSQVLPELAVVIVAAALAALVFQKLRLPLVLGYIVAGLLIGPHVAGAVADASLVATLSDLGVILLFFTIGLEFSVRTVARVGLPTLLTVVVELSAVVIAMYAVGRALGWTSTEAVFAAVGTAIASTMLVVKGLEARGLGGPDVELILAMMVVEDLCSILLLAVLTGVASGAGVSAGELAALLGKLGGFLVAMIVAGLLVIPRVIRAIARTGRSEPLVVTSLAICFGMVWLAVHAGYSLALGAFAAGMLIAESGKGPQVDELVRPFRDLFAAIFFISIGMTIVPGEVGSHWVAALVVAVALVVVKTCAVTFAGFLTGNGVPRAVRAGLALSQIGEFSFIVVAVGVAAGVMRGFLLPIVVGASCVTAISGALQIRMGQRAASWVDSKLPRPIATFVSFYESWIGRLRAAPKPESIWSRLRRPIALLLIDSVLLAGTVITAAATHRRVVGWLAGALDLDERFAFVVLVVVACAIAALFAVGIARGAVRMAWLLAAAVIPGGEGGHDLGRSPRRALLLTIELAIVVTLGLPIAAVIQPLVPGGGVALLGIIVILALVTRRSIEDFDKHVRAGSSLILEVLARQGSEKARPELSEVEAVLPGFQGLVPIVLAEGAPAIGKTLAELDLRAKTGASVLAIGRDGGGIANPRPDEPLRRGDVLALAGSDEAVAAARALLVMDSAPG
ncbi:MAG TPA: cation:proton antiporter [Kofleriaceae bacterium]|nr:cation:proton antiporter [Kofleriaceae bacterium]